VTIWAVALGVLSVGPVRAMRQTAINIVVDLTPEGRKARRPDPQHPAYYMPVMGGFLDMGASVARGEHPPLKENVAQEVAMALSRQGYLVAHTGLSMNGKREVTYADGTVVMVPPHPQPNRTIVLNEPGDQPLSEAMIQSTDGPYSLHQPAQIASEPRPPPLVQILRAVDPVHGPVLRATPELVVVIQWGDLHPESVELTSTPLPQKIEFNLDTMVGLIVGNGLSQDFTVALSRIDSANIRELIARTRVDRYFVVIKAYDFQSCLPGHNKTLLWRANMSVPSNADAKFADMLPLMLRAGESHFGREFAPTELSTNQLAPKGQVTIGTSEVKDYQEESVTPHTGK